MSTTTKTTTTTKKSGSAPSSAPKGKRPPATRSTRGAKTRGAGASAARGRDKFNPQGHGSAISKELQAVVIEHAAEQAAAVELAKAMCCPNLYPSFGVQDGYSSLPTGDSAPFMVMPALPSTVEGSVTDSLGVSSDQSWGFAFRDPHRSLLYYDPGPRTWEYHGVLDSGDSDITTGAGSARSFDAWNFSSGDDVHGPKQYTGVVESGPGTGFRGVSVNKLQYLQISGLPASAAVTITLSILSNDETYGFYRLGTTTAGGVWKFDLSSFTGLDAAVMPNFFHIMSITSDTAVTAGTYSLGGTAVPVLRQLPLANFQDMNMVIEKIRFPALNLMYSNTAPALSKNGFLSAWQVPSNLDPFSILGLGFEDIANRPGADRIMADDGGHTFWTSTDPLDWEYLEVGDPGGGNSSGGNYIINAQSDYLCMVLSIPVAAGRGGYWSVFTDTQFRHDSVWLPLRYPSHNRRTFELALEIQSRIPRLHCNPFHIKDIFKWIGQHKGQIKSTGDLINSATGNRAGQFITPMNNFLDIWFK